METQTKFFITLNACLIPCKEDEKRVIDDYKNGNVKILTFKDAMNNKPVLLSADKVIWVALDVPVQQQHNPDLNPLASLNK